MHAYHSSDKAPEQSSLWQAAREFAASGVNTCGDTQDLVRIPIQPSSPALPSVGIATAWTTEFGPEPGSNVLSTLPSGFRRAIRWRFVPLMLVKSPPTSALPSGCTTTDTTSLSAPVPGSNESSKPPSAFNR